MRKYLSLLLLLLPSFAFAQGGIMSGGIIVLSPTGRPVAGATVTICSVPAVGIPCTNTVSIFSDVGLSIPKGNPGTTDGMGNFIAYAPPGAYSYTVTGNGVTTSGQPYTATVAGTGGGTGNVVSGGNNAFTGTNTHSGAESFTTITCQTFSNVQCVDASLVRGHTDVGNEINLAYAACTGAKGCMIQVAPGSYSYTTPIVINNNGHVAKIIGSGQWNTILNYTPSTGTAVLVDTSAGAQVAPLLEDLTIQGPGAGTSTVGLMLGTASGAAGLHGLNINVLGFGTAVKMGAGITFLTLFTHSFIGQSATCFSWPTGINVSAENLVFNDTTFFSGGSNLPTGCLMSLGGNIGDIYFNNSSFDDAPIQLATQAAAGLAHVVCTGCHFENPSQSTTIPITNSGQNLTLRDSVFEQDAATPAFAEWVAAAGGITHIDGGSFFNNSGTPMNQAAVITGTNTTMRMSNTELLFRVLGYFTDSGTNSIITPNVDRKIGTGGGNYTSASTSFVAVDATNLKRVFWVPVGATLTVQASGTLFVQTAPVIVFAGLADNGTIQAQTAVTPAAVNSNYAFSLTWVIVGDGASHTVDLRYATSNAADSVGIVNTATTFTPVMSFQMSQVN